MQRVQRNMGIDPRLSRFYCDSRRFKVLEERKWTEIQPVCTQANA